MTPASIVLKTFFLQNFQLNWNRILIFYFIFTFLTDSTYEMGFKNSVTHWFSHTLAFSELTVSKKQAFYFTYKQNKKVKGKFMSYIFPLKLHLK